MKGYVARRICYFGNSGGTDSFLEHVIGGKQEADVESIEWKTEVVRLGRIEPKSFCSYSTVHTWVTFTMTL